MYYSNWDWIITRTRRGPLAHSLARSWVAINMDRDVWFEHHKAYYIRSEKHCVGGDCDSAGTPTQVASMQSCLSEPSICAHSTLRTWLQMWYVKHSRSDDNGAMPLQYNNVQDGFVMCKLCLGTGASPGFSLMDLTCRFGFLNVTR